MKRTSIFLILSFLALFFTSCTSSSLLSQKDRESKILVSVRDQTMLLTKNGQPIKAYRISTSKYGLGSQRGSKRTPLGDLEVVKKIGGNAPSGSVFKGRERTGEILKPNAPGRDPVLTRILWLTGKNSHNRNTMDRYIYIHGTPEESRIGRPASHGCVRMKSKDVIDLYKRVGEGAQVKIFRGGVTSTPEGRKFAETSKGKRQLAFLY